MRPNSVIVWQGASLIDGASPIIVVASGLRVPSNNRKTGAMVQMWILRADVSPVEARAYGMDVATCGGCTHRAQHDKTTGEQVRVATCYVNLGQAPRSIWGAWRNGDIPTVTTAEAATLLAGQKVRVGAYGDPAAAPLTMWRAILSRAAGHTGYTHQWRAGVGKTFAGFLMASCETERDVRRANALGFGTFRVVPTADRLPRDGTRAIECDADRRGAQCADCGRCNGRRQNVVIHAHGASARLYAPTTPLAQLTRAGAR